MHRRNRFAIALISAAITFGVLTATLGPMRWQRWGRHGWHHHHHCNELRADAPYWDR